MSESQRPLLADLKTEIQSLTGQLSESVQLRMQLARLEIQSDLASTRRLALTLIGCGVMALTGLPLLAACLAVVLGGYCGLPVWAWLAIFSVGLLGMAAVGSYLAWRRFRRRFIGLEQTLEELREDLTWLQEWTGDSADR